MPSQFGHKFKTELEVATRNMSLSLQLLVLQLSFRVVSVEFILVRHGRRDAFSVDVLDTKGTLTVGYSRGITRLTDESGNVVDHNILNLPDNVSVFKVAYQQIVDYLEGGPLPDCSRNSYMAVNEIGFATIESGKTRQLVNLPNLRRDRLVYANG